MKLPALFACALIGIIAFTQPTFAQDHGHFYVGAVSTNQGAQLVITNAADFASSNGYVKTLIFTNGGPYAGYYHGNITFEALSATTPLGDPAEGSAALGAWLHAQVVSVEGPAGGEFAFWNNTSGPAFSVPCGTTSTNTFHISNNNGAPGTNPFGHIHGRRYTATLPGLYTVTLRAVDFSTNGAGGGPIHTPSDDLKMYLQAGITLTSITKTGNVASVTFGAAENQSWALEYIDSPDATNWTETGEVIVGNDYLQTFTDTNAVAPTRIYRVKSVVLSE